jgi:predicted ABC-type ATPase
MAALKPVLTVIAGPNGSGKTTLTKQLLSHEWTADSTYINADEIARDKFGDWNSPEAVRQAAEYADRLRAQCIQDGNNFAYETVFSTPRRLQDLENAQSNGFFIRFFFVSTQNPDINIARVERRVEVGGHDVPEDKIITRYQRSMNNLFPALCIADRAYVFDNSVHDQDPALLFRTVNGLVKRVYQDHLPDWSVSAFTDLESRSSNPTNGKSNPPELS